MEGSKTLDQSTERTEAIHTKGSYKPMQEKYLSKPENGDSPQNSMVMEVIDDIIELSNHGTKKRSETLFYYIVEGGDVNLIRQILEELREPSYAATRLWLLGVRNHESFQTSESNREGLHIPKHRNATQHLTMFLIFLAMSLLYIIFTPIFYVTHQLGSYIWLRLFAKPPSIPTLPLALVCRSKSLEMMKLFYNEGLRITDTDDERNNVAHYLAHMSSADPEGAQLIWSHLTELYKIADIHRLCFASNRGGMSPLELCAKTGSVQFLNFMMETHGLNKHVYLKTSKSHTQIRTQDEIINSLNSPVSETSDKQCIRLIHYDLTPYESGDTMCRQSVLLRLLSERDVTKIPGEDLLPVLENSVINVWIQTKAQSKGLSFMRLLSTLYGFLITLSVLAYMIQTGGDNNMYPLGINVWDLYVDYAKSGPNSPALSADCTGKELGAYCKEENAYFGNFHVQNWCYLQALNTTLQSCGPGVNEEQIFKNTGAYIKVDAEAVLAYVRPITIGLMGCYLALDFLMRIVFLWKNLQANRFNNDIVAALSRVICHKLPGSYLYKQLSVLSVTLFLSSICLSVYAYEPLTERIFEDFESDTTIEDYSNLIRSQYEIVQYFSFLTVLCLLLRFVALIYSLRILPSIGHFVIFTFKMTETLLQFIIVFFLITGAFAVIFHFILRDPYCPLIKMQGFGDVFTSAYNTMLIALGMSDFPEEHDILAAIAYLAYLLLSAVVLLNLIIGVMTTVVEEANAKPQRSVGLLMHKVGDALAAEAGWQILTFPLSGWLHKWFLRKSSFIVKVHNTASCSSSCCGGNDYSVHLLSVQRD